jgi:hypothetical protein
VLPSEGLAGARLLERHVPRGPGLLSSAAAGSCPHPPTSPEWPDSITERNMTQMLPFADEEVLGFDAQFESGLDSA